MKKEKLIGYKAFCQDEEGLYAKPNNEKMRYKEGEIFETNGSLVLCENGLHFCKELKNIFKFYPLIQWIKVHKVEILGDVLDDKNKTKSCTNKLKVLEALSFEDILQDLKLNLNSGISSSGVNRSKGINYSSGINDSDGINESKGINYSFGVNNSFGINESKGINESNGINYSFGINYSSGINDSDGINDSNGVNNSFGINHSIGVNKSFGINESFGVNKSFGINESFGVNKSNGINHSIGVNKSFGINESFGVNNSFGILNSQGVCNSLFLANKKPTFSIFGIEVTENRFNIIKNKLFELLDGWYPNFNNIKKLHLKYGNNWEVTPIQAVKVIEKKEAWADMPVKAIKYVMSLEEFNKEMFEEITGIDTDKIEAEADNE